MRPARSSPGGCAGRGDWAVGDRLVLAHGRSHHTAPGVKAFPKRESGNRQLATGSDDASASPAPSRPSVAGCRGPLPVSCLLLLGRRAHPRGAAPGGPRPAPAHPGRRPEMVPGARPACGRPRSGAQAEHIGPGAPDQEAGRRTFMRSRMCSPGRQREVGKRPAAVARRPLFAVPPGRFSSALRQASTWNRKSPLGRRAALK